MTFHKYADEFIAKSCNVTDVTEESSLNGGSIESVDASVRHSLRNQWAPNPHTDLTETAFFAESLLSIRKDFESLPKSIHESKNPTGP